MKKALVLLCVCALLFTACKKDDISPSSSTASQSSFIASNSQTSSVALPSSSTASSKPVLDTDSANWPTAFVSVTPTNGEVIMVELKKLLDWDFDGTSTFSEDELKVMEVISIEKVLDVSKPFETADKASYFETPEEIPEGFGFISSERLKIGDFDTELVLWKTWPSDSDVAWYPHFYRIHVEDYILTIGFYTPNESCEELHSIYESIIKTILIFN